MLSDDHLISDVSLTVEDDVPVLSSRNAFFMLCNCGFVVTLHWKQLIGHLGVSLDERKRLEMLAMVHHDFNHALEEGLDIWLRGGAHRRSWEQLIEGVELFEPVTADNMKHSLQVKQLPSHRNIVLVTKVACIVKRHMSDLCLIIKDPSPIARELFEHRLISESCYLSTLSTTYLPHGSQPASNDMRTRSLMETVYRSTIERCRTDIVNTLIGALEDIYMTKSLASLMRKEFDQALLHETVSPNYYPLTSQSHSHSPLSSQPHSHSPTWSLSPSLTFHPHSHSPLSSQPYSHSATRPSDCIDLILTETSEKKFAQLQFRLGSLLKKLQTSFDTKPVPLPELKDRIVFSFSDLQESIDPCESSSSVIKALRNTNYCTIANYTVVECLVNEFELTEMVDELESYDKERRIYYETIKLEDFVQEAKESIGQNRNVIFRLDWRKGEKSLAEFEQMVKAVFGKAARYITLKCVKDGSVIMVCECPAAMTECLKILAEGKEDLLSSYGVLRLTIGDTVVMKRRPKVYCSFDESGYFGSDMRGVELLPESLLYPSKGIPEDDEVPLPPIPPRTAPAPSYCRKTSLPGKLDHLVSPKFLSSHKKPHDPPSLHDPRSLPLQHTYSSPSPAIGSPQRSLSESKPHPSSNPPPLPSRSVSFGATFNSRISNTSRSPLSTFPVHREPGGLSQSPEGEEGSSESYHDKAPFTSTPLDATIGSSTYVISVKPDPLKQFPWYWGGPMTSEDVSKSVYKEPDESFIVYKSGSSAFTALSYTITFRHNGNTKHVTVRVTNNSYSLNGQQLQFDSLPLLIQHYKECPLPLTDSEKYPVKLTNPVIQEFIDGDESELDIKQTIQQLEEVFKKLEGKTKEYKMRQDNKSKIKKSLDELEQDTAGYKANCEVLASSLNDLEKSISSIPKRDSVSLNKMTRSYHTIKTKIGNIEKKISENLGTLYFTRTNYHTSEKICNSVLVDLNEINKERDALISQLTNQGFTEEDIYASIDTSTSNDTEETYMRFYKKQLDMDESDIYEYVTLGETRHRGVVRHPRPTPRHQYDYPNWEFRRKKEPFYETVRNEKRLSISTPDIPSFSDVPSTHFDTPSPTPVVPPKTVTSKLKVIAWSPASWYCNVDRKTAEKMLSKTDVGTFLCRPVEPTKDTVVREDGALHVYTLHIVSAPNLTIQLKILRQKNMFGFNVPCIFNSLYDLLMHHSHTSLQVYDPRLTETLKYPVNM